MVIKIGTFVCQENRIEIGTFPDNFGNSVIPQKISLNSLNWGNYV